MKEKLYCMFQLIYKNATVYLGVTDDASSIEEKMIDYEYDSYNVFRRRFKSSTEAFTERARILEECIKNNELPRYNEESESRPLYCSFCGKCQFELKKLIAGPSVFICDECVDITVDVLEENGGYIKDKALASGGKDWFEKAIEFPPEFRQSGVTILSYFSEIVREKYPQDDVIVRIEQCGKIVRLIVQTPKGAKKIFERELEQYGMVVTGNKPPESLGLDAIETIKLKNELRLAQVRVESQSELLEYQRSQVDGLLNMIGKCLKVDTNNDVSLTISPTVICSPHHSTTLKQAIEGAKAGDTTINSTFIFKYQEKISALEDKYKHDKNILDVIEALKKYEPNQNLRIALKSLDQSPKKGKAFLDELMQLGESIIVGAAGSGTWELLRSAVTLLGM